MLVISYNCNCLTDARKKSSFCDKLHHLKTYLNELVTLSEGVCLLFWLWCHCNLGFTLGLGFRLYHLSPVVGCTQWAID